MLKTGKEHIESLNDGRTVYIGNEKVQNVTTHPAFRNAAKTVASLYDIKHDPEYRDILSFEEDGERYSMWFLRAKNRDDLRKRSVAHKKLLMYPQVCLDARRTMWLVLLLACRHALQFLTHRVINLEIIY